MTELLFRDNAYLAETTATVMGISGSNGIVLDRTVFYAAGGGQPGDSGSLWRNGAAVPIATAVWGDDKREVVHVPIEPQNLPEPGEELTAAIDWTRRHRHMRIHTGLHLLSVVLPFPVTGGAIGADEGRLDFDLAGGDVPAREDIEERLNALVAAGHAVTSEWITDDELAANPGLVKTMKVRPPMGSGRVRLVRIGDVDLQPCGGTHVRSTSEIGRLTVGKIESKGKQNRRVRIRIAE